MNAGDAPRNDPDREIRRLSRRSFMWAALAVAGAYGGFKYLASRSEDEGVPWPFRRAMDLNEELETDYFSAQSLAKTYPRSAAVRPLDNGDEGLDDGFDPDAWRLAVVGADADPAPKLTLAEIQKLPHVELTAELRCIEGWAVVVNWTGCRLSDFIAAYPPNIPDDADADHPAFVGLETPGGGYYVGIDWQSALHPQTLLCWAMNGKPLELEHGAPLRLIIPTKYGIKNIKRIGTLAYSMTERPRDFWYEQGYDYYAGL